MKNSIYEPYKIFNLILYEYLNRPFIKNFKKYPMSVVFVSKPSTGAPIIMAALGRLRSLVFAMVGDDK